MRILQVGTGFASMPPKGAYGAERTIHSLSSALVSLGHEVMVLDIEEKNRPSVPYQVAEVPLRWRKDVNLPTHILRGFAFRQASGQGLKGLLKMEHFDIIHFHNQFSAHHIDLAHHHNVSTVYFLHNALWFNDWACNSFWQRFKFFQDIRAIRKAYTVICHNDTTRANLSRYFGVLPSKIAVIPPGIDESWLVNIEISEAIKNKYAPEDEPIVLNVARIAPYKNQLTLAKAMPLVIQEIPKVRFLFVGPVTNKSYASKVRRTIADAGVAQHAIFLGEVPHTDLPELYALCRVFAIPSESEAFGVVVLESMATGKATVASDIETFQDMLNEGRGITVPTFDYEALANAIISLLRDDAQRKVMGQQARKHVQLNYTWVSVARKTAEVYKSLVREGIPL